MERKGKKEGKIFDTKEDGKSFMIYRDLRDFFFYSVFQTVFLLGFDFRLLVFFRRVRLQRGDRDRFPFDPRFMFVLSY